jgi:hypothetical protein
MFKKYSNWYRNLTPLKKLLVSFILNWIYWLTAWLIAEKFFFDERRSWRYHAFHATWMAFFMTIPFNWKELKMIFKGERDNHTQRQNNQN